MFKFDSWAKTYNLYCDRRLERTHGRVLAFLINASCCLILLHLSDLWGRKTVLMLNSVLILVFMMGAALSSTYFWKMGMLGAAFGCEGDFTPLFIFMMAESTSRTAISTSTEYEVQVSHFACHFDSLLLRICVSESHDLRVHKGPKSDLGDDNHYRDTPHSKFLLVSRKSCLVS